MRKQKKALLSDKHVLVEKPITLNLGHLDDLIEISRERKLLLGGIFQWRFLNCVKIAKKLFFNNELGKLFFINFRFLKNCNDSYFEHGRGSWKMDGGGVLMKQAIHFLDLMIYLVGFPVSWEAHISNDVSQREIEDTAFMSFKFTEGFGTLISIITFQKDSTLEVEIIGIKGRFVFNANDEVLYSDFSLPFSIETKGVNVFDRQIINFIESINYHENIVVTPEECRKSLSIIINIYGNSKFEGKLIE